MTGGPFSRACYLQLLLEKSFRRRQLSTTIIYYHKEARGRRAETERRGSWLAGRKWGVYVCVCVIVHSGDQNMHFIRKVGTLIGSEDCMSPHKDRSNDVCLRGQTACGPTLTYEKQKHAVFVALCTLQPHTNTNSFLCAAWFPLQVIIIRLFFKVLAQWLHSWMNTWFEMWLSGRCGSFAKQGLGSVGEDTWQKYKTTSLMSL